MKHKNLIQTHSCVNHQSNNTNILSTESTLTSSVALASPSTVSLSKQIPSNNTPEAAICPTKDHQSLSPLFNNSTILTRSAAVRQKQHFLQQQKKQPNNFPGTVLSVSSQKHRSSAKFYKIPYLFIILSFMPFKSLLYL